MLLPSLFTGSLGNKHHLQNKEFYCYAVTEKKDIFEHEAQNTTNFMVNEEELPIQVQQILSPNITKIPDETDTDILHQQGLMLLETPVRAVYKSTSKRCKLCHNKWRTTNISSVHI